MVAFEGGAAGAVRLALIDLSERGDQPIWSADRRVAILAYCRARTEFLIIISLD